MVVPSRRAVASRSDASWKLIPKMVLAARASASKSGGISESRRIHPLEFLSDLLGLLERGVELFEPGLVRGDLLSARERRVPGDSDFTPGVPQRGSADIDALTALLDNLGVHIPDLPEQAEALTEREVRRGSVIEELNQERALLLEPGELLLLGELDPFDLLQDPEELLGFREDGVRALQDALALLEDLDLFLGDADRFLRLLNPLPIVRRGLPDGSVDDVCDLRLNASLRRGGESFPIPGGCLELLPVLPEGSASRLEGTDLLGLLEDDLALGREDAFGDRLPGDACQGADIREALPNRILSIPQDTHFALEATDEGELAAYEIPDPACRLLGSTAELIERGDRFPPETRPPPLA